MIVENCRIVSNRQLYSRFFEMEVEAPKIAEKAVPGQFIMIKTAASYEPFLKRPMGVSRIDRENALLSYIYQVKGRGTHFISQMLPDQQVEVSGPMGNGWKIDQEAKKVLLVGGGVGITPLMPLAEQLYADKISCDILWGAAEKGQLFNFEQVKAHGKILVATEDGSFGEKGNVILLLPQNPAYDMIYCCGPRGLMAAIAKWAEEHDLPCQVSMEERMGCGIGTCMGCVCRTKADDKTHYKRICCDGPVFDSREVVF